jgi:hypothetical protein
MDFSARPLLVKLLTAALIVSALLTGWVGLSAFGYLVPAFTLAVLAVLLWLARFGTVLKWVTIANVASGLLLVLVLAFGEFLGQRKLDVSGVALLTNLASGGPLLSLLAGPIVAAFRPGRTLTTWFAPGRAADKPMEPQHA